MTSYAHPADPVGDYVDHDTRLSHAAELVRRRDAALIEAIRVRLAPPFRPRIRVLTSDYPGRLRIVIGDRDGFVTADVDETELERARREGDVDLIAEAVLKAGQRALRAVGIEPEEHIERGTE